MATGEKGHKQNREYPGRGALKWVFRAGKHFTGQTAKQKPSGYQIASVFEES